MHEQEGVGIEIRVSILGRGNKQQKAEESIMNTMKKWVVAGLVGLFSVGVAWAVPDLDLNVEKWADNDSGDGHDVHFSVAYPGTMEFTDYSVSDGGQSTAYAARGGSSGGNRTGTVTIDGSSASLSYLKSTGLPTASAVMDFLLHYGFSDGQVLMSDYSGITINFADALPSGLVLNDYYLSVVYWNSAINEGLGDYQQASYSFMVNGHDAGSFTLDWTSPNWDGGALPVADITFLANIEISLNILRGTVGTTFTETFNSITLDGVQGVPEPETVWMIVAVLASLGMTFRRQLTSLFVKA